MDYNKLDIHINNYRTDNIIALKELSLTILFNYIILYIRHDINIILWSFLNTLILVKWFIIFHDTGHNSFFSNKKINKYIQKIVSYLIFTPSKWKITHIYHHNNNGRHIEYNETIFMTKNQYDESSKIKKIIYNILRHPIIFFIFSPFIMWFIIYRTPIESNKWIDIYNKMENTIFNIILVYIIYSDYFIYYYISVYCSAFAGLILFHWQHTYEDSYICVNDKEWNKYDSALKGCSHLKIPYIFKWFTMGIEYHHIHHLNSKVPGYLLKKCHDEAPKHFWKDVTYLNYKDIFKSLKLMLYDEINGIFI